MEKIKVELRIRVELTRTTFKKKIGSGSYTRKTSGPYGIRIRNPLMVSIQKQSLVIRINKYGSLHFHQLSFLWRHCAV